MTKTNKINRKSRAKIRNEKKEEKIILTKAHFSLVYKEKKTERKEKKFASEKEKDTSFRSTLIILINLIKVG